MKVQLVKCFIGDTILYRKIDFDIRIINNENEAAHLFFEKYPALLPSFNASQQREKNGSVVWLDSNKNKIVELFQSPIYPNEVIVKPNGRFDLMFICATDRIINNENIQNDNELRKKIKDLVLNGEFVFYKLNNNRVIIDSSRIELDKNFSIEYRAPLVGE